MARTSAVLGFLLLLPMATSAAPIAEFAPPIKWRLPAENALSIVEHDGGGPAGGAWAEITCTPTASANFAPDVPLSLEPGARLSVWVKGNGSESGLVLYMFGGQGHRGYNIPLDSTEWRQVTFDITEDFGENHWTWAEPVRLDLSTIGQFKLFVPHDADPNVGAVGIGAISLEPPVKGDRPAVMLATCKSDVGDPAKAYRVIPHLQAAGFETHLRRIYAVGAAEYLSADQLARYNAVIILDLPYGEKGGYPKNFDRVAEVLHEYVEQGGGLLSCAVPAGWNNIMPTINTFLQPWGAQCLDEQVVDPDNIAESDAWFRAYPLCWTANVAQHEIAREVKGTWYPGKAWRADGILTTVALTTDEDWDVLLRGEASARSVHADGNALVTGPAKSIASAPPIFAVREVGEGRVGLLPIYPSFLTGGCDHAAWNSMVWDGEAKGLKSDMKTLFLNAIAWLAEPSYASKRFGGYTEPEGEVDYRPIHERPIPLDWSEAAFREPAHKDYLVLVGMQSGLSEGTASPEAMIAAAREAGYSVTIFTESLPKMDGEKWARLCETCSSASSDEFLAIPGLRYRDPQGNSYVLFGTFEWPDEEWYARCFNEKGEVIDTYALYAKVSGWRHHVIHSLSAGANPALHLRHYSCISVMTYDESELIDDAYDDYLLLQENCYYPIPLAVHFAGSPEGVARCREGLQTRLWANSMQHARELLDDGKAGSSYFWNPKPTYLSSGPRLLDWQELNMNSWRADAPGTDKWMFRLSLESDRPLESLRIMDGTHEHRHYRPGEPSFSLEHTGHHGKQNQFTIRARDAGGGELISSHLKTHTKEHVFFMCGDRQNSLGAGSWGYQPWPAQYKTEPDVDISEIFPPHWDGGHPGFGSFCEPTINPAEGAEVASENDLGMLASTKRTLMATRDCTITEEVGDGKFRDRSDWGDCKPTPDLLPREYITHTVRKRHYRVPREAAGFMFVEGTARALRDCRVRPGEMDVAVRFFSLSDHGGKNGELEYFAYTDASGDGIVRHTPEGVDPLVRHGMAEQGDYFASFPRALGSPALFPITPVTYTLHGAPNIFSMTFGTAVPDGEVKAGDTWDYRFAFACFTSRPGELNESPERIRRMYGFAGDPAFAVDLKKGRLLEAVGELRLEADGGRVELQIAQADMPGGLPIIVEGLNERWTAVVAGEESVRFIGVFEGAGYALANVREKPESLFIGHPVTCDDERLWLNLVEWSPAAATVEVHNPTDEPIATTVKTNGASSLPDGRAEVTVEAGTSSTVELR